MSFKSVQQLCNSAHAMPWHLCMWAQHQRTSTHSSMMMRAVPLLPLPLTTKRDSHTAVVVDVPRRIICQQHSRQTCAMSALLRASGCCRTMRWVRWCRASSDGGSA
jgi:hypothetical protein